MIYSPEQIKSALAQYQREMPLSGPEGTWAAPTTAPMQTVPGTVDTSQLAPDAAVQQPDWMGAAQQYAQPVPEQAAPAVQPIPATPQESLSRVAQESAEAAQAVRARGEQQAVGLEQEALAAQDQMAALDARDRDFAEQQKLYDGHAQDLAKRYGELNKQAENMSVVDRRTTGQFVTGALATALAAIGDGFNRMGGNTQTNAVAQVQNLIQQQVDRDLDLQREAIADRRKSAAAALSEYGLARQMGLDARGTEEFARTMLERKYTLQAKSIAAGAQSTDARMLAEQVASAGEAKTAMDIDSLLDRNAKTKASEAYMKAQAEHLRKLRAGGSGGGGGGINYDPKAITAKQAAGLPLSKDEARILQAAQNADRSQEAQADRVAADPAQAARVRGAKLSGDLVVDDPEVAPLHAKDTAKVQGSIDSARRMLDSIDGLLAVRSANPIAFRTPFTDANAQAKALGTTAQLEAKNVYELGALSGPDMGLIEAIAGDPTDWSSQTDSKLRQLRASTAKGLNDKLTARGFRPVNLTPQKAARGSSQEQVSRVAAATKPAPSAPVQRATRPEDLD